MQYIYKFRQGHSEGNKDMQDILGGKGANLAEMCNLNLPVPAGFTMTPAASKFFQGNSFDSFDKFEFNLQLEEAIKFLEEQTGTLLSSEDNPCIISVRSGSKISMPGMLDSVLNLGMNSYLLDKLISKTGNSIFVYDCYRRFIQTYSTVVLGIPEDLFEDRLDELEEMSSESLKQLCEDFKKIVKDEGKRIPSNAYEQLTDTIKAIYKSWDNDRAKVYRKANNIPEDIGTAVTIQAMVYGNKNEKSLTGVLFTRDCVTGDNSITGEYLVNAQGEDIVNGYVTPNPLSLFSSKLIASKLNYTENKRVAQLLSLEESNPDLFLKLCDLGRLLEKHYGDVQDIEFTVEDNNLWVLQTRSAKRTKKANLAVQKQLFLEDIISYETLTDRTKHIHLGKVQKFVFKNNTEELKVKMGSGLGASSGLAVGQIILSTEKAISMKGQDIILVREQTDTEDLEGILAAKGTLTTRGGSTSHAAVVCRGSNLCCVVGANIDIDFVTKKIRVGSVTLSEGDWISLDGETGSIYLGKQEIKDE